jgi:hypothetical protein
MVQHDIHHKEWPPFSQPTQQNHNQPTQPKQVGQPSWCSVMNQTTKGPPFWATSINQNRGGAAVKILFLKAAFNNTRRIIYVINGLLLHII